jgi:hypothetical protein
MKKSRRQKQRKRRQSRKPRISRGGVVFRHYLGHAIEAASICEHTIHLVKNVNKSSEVLTFCQKIDTTRMNKMVTDELIRKFNKRMEELKDNLKFIAENKVVTTIVSFAVRFFDGEQSSEIQKLTASIPNAVTIAKSNSSWFDSLFSAVDAAKIIMWGEWYNTELTEATNNLIAVVTEMIGLQTLPMKTITEPPLDTTQIITEHYTKAVPPGFSEVTSEVTKPPAAAGTATADPIATAPRRHILMFSGRSTPRPGGTSFTIPMPTKL